MRSYFFNKKVSYFIIFKHINRGWKATAYRILYIEKFLCLTIFIQNIKNVEKTWVAYIIYRSLLTRYKNTTSSKRNCKYCKHKAAFISLSSLSVLYV